MSNIPELLIYMLDEDDPKKCTAAKLCRFNIARRIKTIPVNSILLDPFTNTILFKDSSIITAVDCSWNDTSIFKNNIKGIRRRLPLLFAGNPTNYAKPNKLSTAEALAAACILLGYEDKAKQIMNKFKWGHTFLTLNQELFDVYSKASNAQHLLLLEQQYISNLYG